MEDADILAICLLVKDDLEITFKRFKQIKEGGQA